MIKQKIVCDYCSREQFKDKAHKNWEIIDIEGIPRDFCSKKCSSKFIKELYENKKNKIGVDNMKKKNKGLPEEDTEEDVEEEEIEREAPRPKVKKKQEETWAYRSVPSKFTEAVVNLETEEILNTKSALVRILNEIEEIKKRIG